MTVNEIKGIFDWMLDHWAFSAFVLTSIIQIVPIKINPLSALFGWIGGFINAPVMREIFEIKKIQTEQQLTIDENELDRIRFEVLDFANSCRNKGRHTKDEYEHIIVLNTKYHKLLAKTGDANGVFDAEYEYILECYKIHQRDNSFL